MKTPENKRRLGLYVTMDKTHDNYDGTLSMEFQGHFVNVDENDKITNVSSHDYNHPKRGYADINVKYHIYINKYSDADHPYSQWGEMYFDGAYSELPDLERAVCAMKKIDKAMNVLNDKRGYPVDFADYIGRFAESSGCDCLVDKTYGNGSWYNECEFRTMSIGDGINWMRHTVKEDKEWQARLAESTEKKAA